MTEKKITSYDYKTIKVKRTMEAIVVDAYEALGWELTSSSIADKGLFQINLSFKRNRQIKNKMELLKLQEKVDYCLLNIDKIQARKKTVGLAEGITTGVVGTLIFGGGMSMVMVLQGTAYLIGGIALGIVGLGIGLLGLGIYKKSKSSKISKLEPFLESEFDKLADLCEQASNLRE